MVGLRSEAPDLDPFVDRQAIRISSVYGTSWYAPPEVAGEALPLTDNLRFGRRLERFYRAGADRLPTVLGRWSLPHDGLRCHRWRDRVGVVERAMLWLLLAPSGRVLVGLSLDVDCPHRDAIPLLEDCYYLDLTIDGAEVEALAAGHARDRGVTVGSAVLASERHQIVFSSELASSKPADLVQRLVYRADLPVSPESSDINYPAEPNRRPGTIAAVGPYVSVLCGQQDYVENAAFISAAQAVASAVRVREIQEAAYRDLRRFRVAGSGSAGPSGRGTKQRRRTLEQILDNLTRLELDLSVAVEVPADLGALVPSLRAVSYHQAVYDSLGLGGRAAAVSQMLRRLEGAARVELASIESIERRADENRRLRWAVAVGFVSVVAIPISIVLAFLGVNASQVDPDRSMFDQAYGWVYLGVGLLAATAVLLALTLYAHQARQLRREVPPALRR